MVGSEVPQPFRFPLLISKAGPAHLITADASLHLGHFLHRRFNSNRRHLDSLVQSSVKNLLNISYLGHIPCLKDLWHESSIRLKGIRFLHWPKDLSSARTSYMLFFSGVGRGNSSTDLGSDLNPSRRGSFNGWGLTNTLLVINVLVYIAQIATKGKLLLLGAKINNLIDKGQLWRLATSSLLHANIGHLMVNCYSLNSVGPTVESISGPRRYLAVYITSAVASSAMSYWFTKAPAVGASGAIFGLVGAFAVFVLRHRGLVRGGTEDLQHIARVVILNLGIGLFTKGIDNWGHVGGLLGGAATSWLIGPAWKYESLSNDGRGVFADRAPIFFFVSTKTPPPPCN